MIRPLLVIALLSCGSRSQPPPAQAAPPSEAAPPLAPASPTDAASPPATDAAEPAGRSATAGSLYFYGKPLPAGHDDRHTCRATEAQIRSCTGACTLMPPVKYWEGEPQCSGVDPGPPDLSIEKKRLAALAIPACACTCDAAYKAASAAYQKQIRECAEVP